MDIKAITLVYFKESKRRKNESGMTTSLENVRPETKSLYKRYSHENRHPEMPINQKGDCFSPFIET